MPKYLVQVSYSSDGIKGLFKDKASGRKAVVTKAVESSGGKIESFYYAFGEYDVILIVDMPDNISAACLSLTVSAAGLARCQTTPLLTIEETDSALNKEVPYRPPGR
jgi:uncharacterized protein with GYD domain